MNKYLYKIKDLEIPPWIKYWFLRKSKINFDLSEILNGTSFDLTNTVNKKLHLIDIFGNSVQNGEPTPENPLEVKSSGDNGNIVEKFVNKNVFGFNRTFDTSMSGLRIKCTDNEIITFKGTATSDYLKTIELTLNSPLKANTEYYASALSNIQSPTRFKMWGYDKNHTMVVNQIFNGKFTPSEDVISIAIKLENMSIGTTYDIEAKFQIEKGRVKTNYEPHQEQLYTIPCQQPMRAIGNVKDTFIKVDGVWYERHIIEKGVLGTENYRVATYWEAPDKPTADSFNTAFFGILVPHTFLNSVFLCNRFEYTGENYWSTDKEGLQLTTSDNRFRMRIAKNKLEGYNNDLTNTQKCRLLSDYLNNNLTEVLYSRVEPLDLPCTQAQITALENLQKARTYKNITHIFSEDEVPAELEIQYYKEKGE